MKTLGALALLGFLAAGSLDYQQEQDDLQVYCKNVAEGVWPDYKEIYETHCKKQAT